MKLSSFIFRRMNVRDTAGDIAFFKIWIDRWEEEREPVDRSSLILHLAANYSPELEEKVLGRRRALVDLPVEMLVSRSLLDTLNGTRFILNLSPLRSSLTAKHVSFIKELMEHYTDNGFLFSIHEDLLGVNPIACSGEPPEFYDFVCEGNYEDMLIVNSLKHTQTAVSKLMSMLSEDVSIDELARTIKGDPASLPSSSST